MRSRASQQGSRPCPEDQIPFFGCTALVPRVDSVHQSTTGALRMLCDIGVNDLPNQKEDVKKSTTPPDSLFANSMKCGRH
jgi:hypothetical protein